LRKWASIRMDRAPRLVLIDVAENGALGAKLG
jgi:hypothetical protein